jgi:phosphatidylserine decarboxylase
MTAGAGSRWFVRLQYILPQHALSRLILAATRVRVTWFKNLLTRGFLGLYAVDLTQAAEPDPYRYASFNAFFTRALAPAARPIDAAGDSIVSPVDGRVSQIGLIENDSLLQAKGRHYLLGDLLAGADWASEFVGGRFATIYLAPTDYHRIHMPVAGSLQETLYVPGRLFSVNAVTAENVPNLFARNERVVTLFRGSHGRFAVVLVGALNVGSMATVWAGDITPRRPRRVTRLPPVRVDLAKGAELGRFNMGSTVILLFAPGHAEWAPGLQCGARLRVGQAIGTAR